MSKKKNKFLKALEKWDISEPMDLADLLSRDKESKKELNAAKIADKLIAEVKRQFAETAEKFNNEKMAYKKAEQPKKLSDLQENEYVFCKTEEEAKRVFNKVNCEWFYDKNGTTINPIAIAHKGVFITYPSTDFADYEAPVSVRPKKSDYNVLSSDKSYLFDLEYYTDHLEQIIKDKDKYIAHMELEAAETSQKKLCPLCDGSGRRIFPNTNPPIDKPCPNCSNQ